MDRVRGACLSVMSTFPTAPRYAFAYGSGALTQLGRAGDRPVLDLVVAADDPLSWHSANLEANPRHYSGVGRLGARAVVACQRGFGARVYYNTLIPCDVPPFDRFKYGAVATEDLIDDLERWTTLYLAGRLHKPVLELTSRSGLPARLVGALDANEDAALRAALLSLPERFDETRLYETVAGLSYAGDFRMLLGERKTKVRDIVAPQLDRFRAKYARAVAAAAARLSSDGDGRFVQDRSPEARRAHLLALPETPARLAAADADVARALRRIVRASSVSQSLKGILTAGAAKSLVYAAAKIAKSLR